MFEALGFTKEAAYEDVYKRQIEELGGEVVKVVFLMELAGLKGDVYKRQVQ